MRKPQSLLIVSLALVTTTLLAGEKSVTVEDVGDPDSFGRAVTYLGFVQTSNVFLLPDCTIEDVTPEDRCVTLDPSGTTSYNVRDLKVLRLPAKATHSMICQSITPLAGYNFFNTTETPQSGFFLMSVGFTIESEVLNDPRAINPATGLPLAGKLESSVPVIIDSVSVQPGQFEQRNPSYSRECIAGLTNRQNLIAAGVPADLIPELFKKPITIRFHSRGFGQGISDANAGFAVRLYGD